jgi:hypothetical protein
MRFHGADCVELMPCRQRGRRLLGTDQQFPQFTNRVPAKINALTAILGAIRYTRGPAAQKVEAVPKGSIARNNLAPLLDD